MLLCPDWAVLMIAFSTRYGVSNLLLYVDFGNQLTLSLRYAMIVMQQLLLLLLRFNLGQWRRHYAEN